MSANQLRQIEINQTPQQAPPGNGAVKNAPSDESALVALYQNITQENESQARSAFMLVVHDNDDSTARKPD